MKIVSVISGWHFPLHFYEMVSRQKLPADWEHDMFVVSHRPPEFEKKVFDSEFGKTKFWPHDLIRNPVLYELDRKLYKTLATETALQELGFTYLLEPNTGGDFTNVNQWMEKYDWKQYDILFMPHDDNYLMTDSLFYDIITGSAPFWKRKINGIDMEKTENKDWWCISNSAAPKFHHIRWCFSFFSREMLELIDGKFDMSTVGTPRVGQYNTPVNHTDLSDWNKISNLFRKFIIKNDLLDKIKYLSPYYRSSQYNIECERGFLHYNLSWPDAYEQGIIANEC